MSISIWLFLYYIVISSAWVIFLVDGIWALVCKLSLLPTIIPNLVAYHNHPSLFLFRPSFSQIDKLQTQGGIHSAEPIS